MASDPGQSSSMEHVLVLSNSSAASGINLLNTFYGRTGLKLSHSEFVLLPGFIEREAGVQLAAHT